MSPSVTVTVRYPDGRSCEWSLQPDDVRLASAKAALGSPTAVRG